MKKLQCQKEELSGRLVEAQQPKQQHSNRHPHPHPHPHPLPLQEQKYGSPPVYTPSHPPQTGKQSPQYATLAQSQQHSMDLQKRDVKEREWVPE